MTFVIVLHDALLYGASYCALDLAKGLRGNGHQCVFMAPEGGPFLDELAASGFQCNVVHYDSWTVFRPRLYENKYVSGNRLKRFLSLCLFARYHYRLARQQQKILGPVDWVISNNAMVSFGFVLARVLKVGHVWQFREFVGEGTGYAYIFSDSVRRYIYRLPAKFVYSTHALKQYYSPYTGNKGEVIIDPHIFSLPAIPPSHHEGGKVFGMLGSVNLNKGQLEITSFFIPLIKKYPGVKLLIAGEGQTEELQKLIIQNGLQQQITLAGYLDKYEFFNRVDYVIMNSRFEGFGRVTIEAMKSRKLLIGRKSTGTYELIGDNERGVLFEDEAGFSNVIDRLMTGQMDENKIVEGAQHWAEKNTEPKAQAGKLLDYLQKPV